MVKRIIPGNMSPWECEINDVKYVYPPGTEQMVPDEVAHVIDAWYASQEPKYPGPVVPEGGNSLIKPFPVMLIGSGPDYFVDVFTLEDNIFYYLSQDYVNFTVRFGYGDGLIFPGIEQIGKGELYYHAKRSERAGDIIGRNRSIVYYNDNYQSRANLTDPLYYLGLRDNKVFYPSKEFDPATVKFVRDTVNQIKIPKLVQGDWNQNDPTADDYIKNRTHWAENGSDGSVLPTTELVPYEDVGGFVIPNALELISGNEYVVKFDSLEFTTLCQDMPENEDGIKWVLGDIGLMEGTPITGEPFVILVVSPEIASEMGIGAVIMFGGTASTISIGGHGEVVHTIDRKFMPGKVVYYWDGDSMSVTDANGNEITAEQAGKEMFDVVIYDTAEEYYWIPYGCVDAVSHVTFNFLKWGESQTVYAGTVPK